MADMTVELVPAPQEEAQGLCSSTTTGFRGKHHHKATKHRHGDS